MSLNTDPYGINDISTTTLKPVEITVDGKYLGTAEEVKITNMFVDEGDPSVDLKDLVGIADVSFYGHVYRDLRRTNKELERKVRLADQIADSRGEDTAYWYNAYEVASKKATEPYMEIIRLKDELSRKAEPASTLQLRYDVRVRDVQIAELTSEVERLKQSRKEQAEKHKQKQANLQANFEQRNTARVRNTKLQRELDQAQNYARALERDNELLRSEQHSGLQGKLNTAVENAKYLAERSDDFESQLEDEKASAAFWHEKYLASEAQLDIAVSKHDYLVDSVNSISDIVNDAANRQGFDLG